MCLHTFILSVFLSVPFCFCSRPFVSVHTLFSACTLFHFTHHDFSFRKWHIKSDFLSLHHICLHTFILSSCPRPFVSVRALLFLSILVCALLLLSKPFCFCLHPFLCLHSFSFYLSWFFFKKRTHQVRFSKYSPYVSAHFYSVFLSAPICFCPHHLVSVCALFSVCTLFHFTYDDLSIRKGHIKSDFLSIHHYVSAHFYSACLLVRTLLCLSPPFCFCPSPFFCLRSFSFYLWWFFF